MSGCTTLRILLGVGSIVYEYHLVRHELGGEKRTRSRADITAHIYDRLGAREHAESPDSAVLQVREPVVQIESY
jgi:hypothetical protein